jgi:phage terminase large subunit-like protein
MSNGMVRLSVNLNRETAEALTELAKQGDITITETVRRSVSIYKYIADEIRSGRKVHVMDQDGCHKVELELL